MAKKVNIQELSRRYTTAVFELAKANNELDKVAADLETVTSFLSSDEKLQKTLNSPLLSSAQQVELVREIAKAAKLGPTTTNFLLIVARNRRVNYLNDIIKVFRDHIAEESGQLRAKITTAEKLTDAQIKSLQAELSEKTGKKVVIEEQLDKSLIGGLVVKIGSKMLDYSVKSRLNKLKSQLKNAG